MAACHGSGRFSAAHAASTRAGYHAVSPLSSTEMSGKYIVLLAIQSAMMSRPVSSICADMDSIGSSSAEEKPHSPSAASRYSRQQRSHASVSVPQKHRSLSSSAISAPPSCGLP